MREAGVEVFGVSYDSQAEHQAFRAKYSLTTPLLMDESREVGRAYGIGTEGFATRNTIVVDSQGNVASVIKEIDFGNHAAQILAALGK